jgi:2,3-bisphosphoglycerate-independent phosphoglycerate mutase
MSAAEVTEAVLGAIRDNKYELMIVNFANGDMVGHTGSLSAAIAAVEMVDKCVGRIVEAVLGQGGSLIVTADHGNCEQMVDPETGGPHTAHTTYDVPLIVVEPGLSAKLREGGRLADIAPTALKLMGLDKPTDMTGESLF